MGFGGPVWHASAGSRNLSHDDLKAIALRVLHGVGDPDLGEWWAPTYSGDIRVFHVRRRLTAAEQERVGDVRDIRGTAESRRRIDALLVAVPDLPRHLMEAEARHREPGPGQVMGS